MVCLSVREFSLSSVERASKVDSILVDKCTWEFF